jgi:hypothetical protein
MNREDIIRMAREAGLAYGSDEKPLGSVTRFAALVAAAEREKVAAWMTQQGYATGHGDTVEDLLKELEWQIRESERNACAKVCEEITNELSNWPAAYDVVTAETKQDSTAIWQAIGKPFVEAIRARGGS